MTLLYIVHVWIENSWVVAHVYSAFLVTCDKQSHLLINPCHMQLLHFAPDTPQCQGETVDHLHTLLFTHGRFMAKNIEKNRQSCRSSHIPSPAGLVPHFFFKPTMEGIISTLCSSPRGRAQAPWISVNLQYGTPRSLHYPTAPWQCLGWVPRFEAKFSHKVWESQF